MISNFDNSPEMRLKLKEIQCFLLDMDGTFYLGDKLIAGSLDFLQACQSTRRQVLFLTNNSSKSGLDYIEKLKQMNVPDIYLNVLTSGQVAGQYALKNFLNQKAFLLGNEALYAELTHMGLEINNAQPDYVLIGYDTTLNYQKMTAVCDFVRSGLPYIATHPDYNCPMETGFAPDIGAIIAFIKASTGREPDVILGKPHRPIVEAALNITQTPAGKTAMVGDRLYTDIATGLNAGMMSILVLSGETKQEDLDSSVIKPDFVFNRLSDMIPYII